MVGCVGALDGWLDMLVDGGQIPGMTRVIK
jgi:hypothetical protein